MNKPILSKFRLFIFASIFLAAFLAQGCATATRGTSEVLVVKSNPSGASVSIIRYTEYIEWEDDQNATEEQPLTSSTKDPSDKIPGKFYSDEKFGEIKGTTPTSFKLVRRGKYVVKIKKDGFETSIVDVNTQVCDAGSAGLAGNVCLGGCLGATVDVASGAMNELVPNPVDVALVPLEPKKEGVTEKSILERLERLNKLKHQGLISEEEYQQKRKEILDGL